MGSRTLEELLKAREAATKDLPLVLNEQESEIYFSYLRDANHAHTQACKSGMQIHDREVSFKGGPVFSHADKKYYSNRKQWDDHLKAHNCVEVGNDYKHMLNKKNEVRGDFNVRKELTQAVETILGR